MMIIAGALDRVVRNRCPTRLEFAATRQARIAWHIARLLAAKTVASNTARPTVRIAVDHAPPKA